jgi:hypothetical protein
MAVTKLMIFAVHLAQPDRGCCEQGERQLVHDLQSGLWPRWCLGGLPVACVLDLSADAVGGTFWERVDRADEVREGGQQRQFGSDLISGSRFAERRQPSASISIDAGIMTVVTIDSTNAFRSMRMRCDGRSK